MCIPCCVCLLLCLGESKAQNKKDSLVYPGLEGMRAKKGAEFQIFDSPGYHRIARFNATESSTNAIYAKPEQRIRTKLKLPIWNAPSFKAALGFYYNNEELSIRNHYRAANINELNLKKVKANLSLMKLLDSKNYAVLRGEVDMSGDFESLNTDSEYKNFTLSAFWGHKKNENTEFGIGLIYRNGFIGNRLLPVLVYNHNFSEKWGVEIALPKEINIRHNCSKTSSLNIQTSLRTDRYLIKRQENRKVAGFNNKPYLFNRLELRTGLAFQKQIIPMVWAEIAAGIRQDVDLFSDTQYSSLSSSEPNSAYFSVSFFVSPPKKSKK